MKKAIAIWVLMGGLSGQLPAAINYQAGFLRETLPERDARMGWFRETRFGMFIHFGLYS